MSRVGDLLGLFLGAQTLKCTIRALVDPCCFFCFFLNLWQANSAALGGVIGTDTFCSVTEPPRGASSAHPKAVTPCLINPMRDHWQARKAPPPSLPTTLTSCGPQINVLPAGGGREVAVSKERCGGAGGATRISALSLSPRRLIIETVIANGRGHLCEPERKQKQIGARYYTASILGLPEGLM